MTSESKIFTTDVAWQRGLLLTAILAVVACVIALLLWQRLGAMQEQLARQSEEAIAHANEARNTARLAQDTAIQAAAKLAVNEARLDEVALQRSQLEELIKSLSRSRDDNLVIDLESAIRLAQQQAQISGSLEPLLAALRSADIRLQRVAQPRLSAVQRAIALDLARLNRSTSADTPSLQRKLDEILAAAEGIRWASAVALPQTVAPLHKQSHESMPDWWQRLRQVVWSEARSLVRVSRIASPDAALATPEQVFFLQQNFKLMVLNARLGLLSRQTDSASADLKAALDLLQDYADTSFAKNKALLRSVQQVRDALQQLELPHADDTLAALVSAGAGR